MIKYLVKDIAAYLQKPVFIETNVPLNKKSVLEVTIITLLNYIIRSVWFYTVSSFIINRYGITQVAIEGSNENSLLEFFLLSVIAYPIVEELLFRYFLKAKTWFIYFYLAFIIVVFCIWCFNQIQFPNSFFRSVSILLILLLLIVSTIVKYKQWKRKELLQFYHKKYFKILFYISSFTFGLVHIFNFNIGTKYFLIIPLVVPHLISGIFFGFTRMKYGMWAAFYIHMAGNFISFILDKFHLF